MKKRDKISRELSIILIVLGIVSLFFGIKFLINSNSNSDTTDKINGMFLLSENTGDISGFYQWEKALDEAGLSAIVKPERFVLEQNPEYFKKLSDKGYELATGYGGGPFWNVSYEEQYAIMEEYKEFIENITGKPLKIFSSKYFAYDENTLRVADALGVPYILARGTGIEAAVYSPEEYNAKLLFVSNLVFEEMGSGSLCDSSLYERGSTAEEFQETLDETFSQNLEDLILVSHVYIGGTRVDWWNAYQNAIDSEQVSWKNFDDWEKSVKKIEMKYEKIPYNTEVKYITPMPSIPLDELELLPILKAKDKMVVFHNGQGEMCLEFLDFIRTINYSFEEHLVSEENFYELFNSYKKNFNSSEGFSNSFGYYPIVFINNKAYSGFNENVKENILEEVNKNLN